MCTLPEAQQAPRPHCGWWRFGARCFGSTMKEIISGGVSADCGWGQLQPTAHTTPVLSMCEDQPRTVIQTLRVVVFMDKYRFIIQILINQSVVAWNDAAAVRLRASDGHRLLADESEIIE